MAREQRFFETPAQTDDTWGRRGEDPPAFLARSTLAYADECRLFLNRNLAKLPSEAAREVFRGLNDQFPSGLFELVTARLMQELGATIEWQRSYERNPDITAVFPDGTVVIEAVTQRVDTASDSEKSATDRLLKVIDETPVPGWKVAVWRLPDIGPSERLGEFRKVVRQLLAVPSPEPGCGERLDLQHEFAGGTLRITLWPGAPADERL